MGFNSGFKGLMLFFYLAGNLHDLRGRWVAYWLICRQNVGKESQYKSVNLLLNCPQLCAQ